MFTLSLYFGININFDAYSTSYIITSNLWVFNCCLNPIIYSKIHVRIYDVIRRIMLTVREKWSCMSNLNCRKNPSTSQTNDSPAPTRLHQVDENQQQQHGANTGLEMDNMGALHNSTAGTPVVRSRNSSELENKLPLLDDEETVF